MWSGEIQSLLEGGASLILDAVVSSGSILSLVIRLISK